MTPARDAAALLKRILIPHNFRYRNGEPPRQVVENDHSPHCGQKFGQKIESLVQLEQEVNPHLIVASSSEILSNLFQLSACRFLHGQDQTQMARFEARIVQMSLQIVVMVKAGKDANLLWNRH